MEALLVDKIPEGNGWQYEPKWDGFRCIVIRQNEDVTLQSKAGRPLQRYFPELVEVLLQLSPKDFVLDGEIILPVGEGTDFNQLLQRIHPAASRIKKLAAEHPAHLAVFDLLSDNGSSLLDRPLSERRSLLERFASRFFPKHSLLHVSPATTNRSVAGDWLNRPGSFLDGIIAKRLDLPYVEGKRTAMQKFKRIRTADCVVGGFRYAEKSNVVGSLLLGLYDGDLLHHVGFTSGLNAKEKKELLKKLTPLIAPPGFTGRAPGGPSRWSTERTSQWQPLRPRLVVEVSFDHVTDNRFRHGTKIVRWRPDKDPKQCTLEQLGSPGSNDFFFKLVS